MRLLSGMQWNPEYRLAGPPARPAPLSVGWPGPGWSRQIATQWPRAENGSPADTCAVHLLSPAPGMQQPRFEQHLCCAGRRNAPADRSVGPAFSGCLSHARQGAPQVRRDELRSPADACAARPLSPAPGMQRHPRIEEHLCCAGRRNAPRDPSLGSAHLCGLYRLESIALLMSKVECAWPAATSTIQSAWRYCRLKWPAALLQSTSATHHQESASDRSTQPPPQHRTESSDCGRRVPRTGHCHSMQTGSHRNHREQ